MLTGRVMPNEARYWLAARRGLVPVTNRRRGRAGLLFRIGVQG